MSTPLDIDGILEQYCDWLLRIRTYEESTVKLHRIALKFFREFLTGRDRRMEQAGPEDVVAWINHRTGEGIGRSTIKGQLCVLRIFYSYLVAFRHMRSSPVACLPEMICEGPAEPLYLTIDQCRRLLGVFDRSKPVGLRDYVITALLWSTGLRTAELCALTWRDIDLDAAMLHVRRGKNRRQRAVFLNGHVVRDLRQYREAAGPRSAAEALFSAMRGGIRTEGERRALTPGALRDIFKAHGPGADIGHPVSPRTLRHTFATHMYERGIDIEDIKEMMGHDSETETCIYIHVGTEAAKQLLLAHIANGGR